MRITRLKVEGLRCLAGTDFQPNQGLNVFVGPNGAGKTSVLEAAYALGSGKSFRFGGADALIERSRAALQVYAEVEIAGRSERLGFERSRQGWRAQRAGERVAELAELASLVPMVCFSPESHELISGGSEVRRRFYDWIVFHVEPGFVEAHRRYGRTLRQRNALLKRSPSKAELDVWTADLAHSGEALAALRERSFGVFSTGMAELLLQLLSELGTAQIIHKRGWREGMSLHERLCMLEAREREVGYTLAGPHRADWSVSFAERSIREHGSRGQQKLVAMATVLIAAGMYRQARKEAPLVGLDDLASELDLEHQRRAVLACAALGAQTWVTGTYASPALDAWNGDVGQFHVEHGQVFAAVG